MKEELRERDIRDLSSKSKLKTSQHHKPAESASKNLSMFLEKSSELGKSFRAAHHEDLVPRTNKIY